jgi:hypothetical protein
MSTPSSVAVNSRSFASGSSNEFWSDLFSAMPIVIFFRGLRQALSR